MKAYEIKRRTFATVQASLDHVIRRKVASWPLVAIGSVILFSACAGARPKRDANACITNAQIAPVMATLERMIDTVAAQAGVTTGGTILVEDKCWKRTYERKGKGFVFYRNPGAKDGSVQGKTFKGTPEKVAACWTKSTRVIDDLRVPWARNILVAHRHSFAWEWDNLEIGPGNWLNCDGTRNDELESNITLLHELLHDLKEGQCLFSADGGDRVCFQLEAGLPPRSLAKLDSFPTKEENVRTGFAAIQRMYLTDSDQQPIMLFDELNAYTITTRAWTALVRKLGPVDFFEGDRRTGMLLPLFAFYSTHYLVQLKKTRPAMFEKEFGHETKNRKALVVLLERAGVAHEEWLGILSSIRNGPKEIETNLWQMYVQERRVLGL